jgi:hypothetical protein
MSASAWCWTGRGAGNTDQVGADRVDAYDLPEIGCVDHVGGRDGDADVSDGGGAGAEEDEVAGLEWLTCGQ